MRGQARRAETSDASTVPTNCRALIVTWRRWLDDDSSRSPWWDLSWYRWLKCFIGARFKPKIFLHQWRPGFIYLFRNSYNSYITIVHDTRSICFRIPLYSMWVVVLPSLPSYLVRPIFADRCLCCRIFLHLLGLYQPRHEASIVGVRHAIIVWEAW